MSDMMNDPVVKAIVEARVKLLFEKPFFGNLATRLNLIDATSWCPTAATDGRNFYYNREFIKKLKKTELLFLVGHEVLHCVYDHLGRRSGRTPDIWNMANDYIVNYTLVKEKVGEMIKGGLYSDEYTDEMSSEEVYKLLEKNSTKIQMPLDMHLELGPDQKDSDGKGGSGKGITVTVMGDGNGPPQLSEEELERIRQEVRAATISAAQASGAGNVPAGVLRLIEQLTEPKLDWRSMLEMHIQSANKDDFSFRKFSKKTWATRGRAILPGQLPLPTIDVAVCIDMSGSISQEMASDFLSEVKGIMDQFADFRLEIWTFDTQTYGYKVFTPNNADEIYDYKCLGGGGTDFMCNWEFMKENDIEPHKLVMFTDGYPCGSWGDENYCDTLFIIHSDKSIEPPFGAHAHYE